MKTKYFEIYDTNIFVIRIISLLKLERKEII